jgi:hypothetical protein
MLASDLIAENRQLRNQLKIACDKLMSVNLNPKQLTDGEILNMYLEQTNGNKDLDILEFARAILKKAQEK